MNIAMFVDNALPCSHNGVTVEVDELAQELKKRGHNVLVVTVWDKKTKKGKFNGYNVIWIKGKKMKSYEDIKYRLTMPRKKLREVFNKFDPDIIHVHSPISVAYWAMVMGDRKKIPIVSTYHTYTIQFACQFLETGMDSKSKFLKFVFEREKLKKGASKTIMKIGEPLTNLIYDVSDYVTAPSHAVKKYLEKKEIDDVLVVPNWIRNEKYPDKKEKLKKKFGIKRGEFIILHSGRLSGEKRIDVLIKAFDKLKNSVPKAKLFITSKGPLKPNLEKMIQERNLQERVILTGFLSDAELESMYELSHVFASASVFDTFNLCVLRALRKGVPVIGSNKEGVGELVIDKYNGFHVRKNDKEVDNYAKMFKKLYKNSDLREKLGKNAIESSKKYDFDLVTDKMLDVYEKAIEEGREKSKLKNFTSRMKFVFMLLLLTISRP